VRLLGGSSVQLSPHLYPSGLFADGCVCPRTEILGGRPKYEQWRGDPLELNSVVHHEIIGPKAAG
jgi:hypothetical protein